MNDAQLPTGSAAGPDGLDLSPRDTAVAAPRPAGRWRRVAIGLVVVVGGGILLFQMLNQATVYFYNVDEAVREQDEIGERRVRVQGHVIADTIVRTDGGISFTLAYGGKTIDVVSSSPPPDLFEPDIPVVVEGVFDGETFRSDEILVRHDPEYEEKNDDRLTDARNDAERADDAGSAATDGSAGRDPGIPS